MLLRLLGVGLIILFLLVVVLVVGSYTFLPSVAERQFSGAIQDRLNLDKAPQVTLKSEPPLNILAGKFKSGRVVLEGLSFEGIRPERTVVNLDPFDLNLPGSLRAGEFESKKPLSGEIVMDLPEQELVRLANTGNGGPTVQSVTLQPDRMIVDLQAQVMGINVPVSVVGTLKLRARTLAFEPRGISAFGVSLPQGLSDRLVSEAGFEYPLDDLPYDTEVSDIRVEDDKVVVEGRIDDIPVNKPPG